MVLAKTPPMRYLKYLSRFSCMWKAWSGDPVISTRLGKVLVKWVAVEDMLRNWIYILSDKKGRYEIKREDTLLCRVTSSRIRHVVTRHWE